jgi:hypothetical protein
MNWHITLKQVYSKLNLAGYENISKDLYEAQLSGSTGGEILDIVLTKLYNLEKNEPAAYSHIKDEVNSLKTFARSIGYNF